MQKQIGVVGSRALAECPALLARLDALHRAGEVAGIVSGGAAGVDELAARWATRNRVPLVEYRPDYRAHGPAAPLVRNGLLVAAADLLLVCWDGVSTGTLDSARKAARLGVVMEWLVAPAPGAAPVAGGLGL
ncbi:SLOG family protein [Hymenobacter rubripertinctus]|uniref:SLOG family protein n=1 Tax=Hymenobacter rubripertinctus TaxID=2029981 RepID=UPI001FE54191|nr:SLOG family protein [Hymenobacter rubripertinctus]